MVTIVTVGLDG